MAIFVPKDRKSLFRQFLSGMYDAVVITDHSGHIVEINERAEEHFGYTIDDLLDRHISVLISGVTAEVVQRIRRGFEENNRMLIDGVGICRDGSKFAGEITVAQIDLMTPDDLVFTIRNVDRRRKLRESLRAKENAFEISPAALFACSLNSRFTEVNPAFLELFDFDTAESAFEMYFSEVFDREPLSECFRAAAKGERSVTDVEVDTDVAGESMKLRVTLAPSIGAGGKIIGVVGAVVSI